MLRVLGLLQKLLTGKRRGSGYVLPRRLALKTEGAGAVPFCFRTPSNIPLALEGVGIGEEGVRDKGRKY